MPSLLQNKFVRFGVFGVVALVLLLVVVSVILASLNNARSMPIGKNLDFYSRGEVGVSSAPAMMMDGDDMAMEEIARMTSSYYPEPIPAPGGYVDGLEDYETTDYSVSARTRQFDEFCASLRTLKTEDRFAFTYLSEETNHCSATFYTDEQYVEEVLSRFGQLSGVEISRNTFSVTQRRERLENRTDILRQQLESVDRTLSVGETQFDEIIAIARASNDASELSSAISEKLRMIDSLTQRKIDLISQLDNILQKSAELNERLDKVQFNVSVQRSTPIYPGQDQRKWQLAWKQLGDEFTNTLIGLSSGLGIFLLKVMQYGVYLLILLLLAKLVWQFGRKVWKM